MLSIDERLEKVYQVLNSEVNERNECRQSLDKVKEAMIYLKNFAKVQEEIKLVGSRKGPQMNLATELESLNHLLEEKQKTLENIPKPPRYHISKRKSNGFIGRFIDSSEEAKAKEVAQRASQIREEKENLKHEIKEIKAKIKILQKTQMTIEKPAKLGDMLFVQENEELSFQYQRLLNYCEKAMFDGQANDIFVRDENDKIEKVNLLKAKRYLNTIKDKNSILAVAKCSVTMEEAKELGESLGRLHTKKEKLEEAKAICGTEEMNVIIYRMNSLINEYNQLLEAEEKAMEGNAFSKLYNKIRNVFHLDSVVRVPKEIIQKREQLAENVNDFILESQKSEESAKAFDTYSYICNQDEFGGMLTIAELKHISVQLRDGAHTVTSLPRRNIDSKQLAEKINYYAIMNQKEISQKEDRKAEAEKKAEEQKRGLSKKALKLLEREGEEKILGYARKYYGFIEGENYNSMMYVTQNPEEASTAATILESIIGRSGKNLSWDNFISNYGNLFSEEALAEETLNIHNIAKKKAAEFGKKIHAFTEVEIGAGNKVKGELER